MAPPEQGHLLATWLLPCLSFWGGLGLEILFNSSNNEAYAGSLLSYMTALDISTAQLIEGTIKKEKNQL